MLDNNNMTDNICLYTFWSHTVLTEARLAKTCLCCSEAIQGHNSAMSKADVWNNQNTVHIHMVKMPMPDHFQVLKW